MEKKPQERWAHCLQLLRENMPEQAFRTWFTSLRFIGLRGNELTLGAPNSFVVDYIEEHHIELLRECLVREFGPNVNLYYEFDSDAQKKPLEEIVAEKKKGPAPLDPQLNPIYSFDNFVEGRANKLARAVGLAIAREPGKSSFNPFFLYGASGVGKTHLVNAIGLRIRELMPETRVLFVPAHVFKTQYTDSVLHNTQNDFIHFYQTIDVLIIDDIQEITTAKTQQAFFHIFNHLHQNGRQIIMTCDREPAQFEGIEERMLTRFKWGMVAEMEKPDIALRRAILKAKILRDGLTFPEEVVDYIAHNVESSVRELQGIVNSIMAYSVVDNSDVTLELTQRVVARAVNLEKKEVTLDDILKTVCRHYGVRKADVLGKTRKKNIVQARQLCMFLCHKYVGLSYSGVGREVGKRDHSTVLHSCNTISARIATEKAFRLEVEDIEAQLK